MESIFGFGDQAKAKMINIGVYVSSMLLSTIITIDQFSKTIVNGNIAESLRTTLESSPETRLAMILLGLAGAAGSRLERIVTDSTSAE